MREFSSAGRASALQAEGHRFEPCSPHQFFGLVVQLVRTPACHAGGRQFESVRGRHYADLAHLVERHLAKVEVAGSSPVIRSMKKESTKGTLFFSTNKQAEILCILPPIFASCCQNGCHFCFSALYSNHHKAKGCYVWDSYS